MVMHSQAAEELQALLATMDASMASMEELMVLEQQAIGELDSDGIAELSKQRKLIWEELSQQKAACQHLFLQYGMPADIEMSRFINMHLAEDAPVLHAQRQRLNERMLSVSRNNERNGIRLRAAAEAISDTLQGLGLLKAKATYGRDGSM